MREKNKRQVNGAQIYNEITDRINKSQKQDVRVVVEQVSAMPGQVSLVCLILASHLE